MNVVFLSIGSNIGDRYQNLVSISEKLKDFHINILQKSSIYITAPWGVEGEQQDYYNQVIKISTHLYPFELLKTLQSIEKDLGRTQKGDYQPRTADIDIIFFNDWVIHSETLLIPHPSFRDRNFVLIPLNEIDQDLIDPKTNLSIQEILQLCTDSQKVLKLSDHVL